MALTSCVELKSAIASWLGRTGDSAITSNSGDFITLAEAYINRKLRVREMEAILDFATTGGSYNLPGDYLAWRRMTYLGSPYVSLEFLHPDVLNRMFPDVSAGIPTHFTIEGGLIKVRPYDDSVNLELLYFAKLSPLIDDEDSNWLMQAYPDLYLAASMVEAEAFLINPDHAALWSQKRDMIIDDISRLSEKTKGPAAIVPVGNFY